MNTRKKNQERQPGLIEVTTRIETFSAIREKIYKFHRGKTQTVAFDSNFGGGVKLNKLLGDSDEPVLFNEEVIRQSFSIKSDFKAPIEV